MDSPVIRVDSIWLATEPMDMRAGTNTALARVIAVFLLQSRTWMSKKLQKS